MKNIYFILVTIIMSTFGAAISTAEELFKGISGGIGFENGGDAAVGPNKVTGYLLFEDKLGFGETINVDVQSTSDFKELIGGSLLYSQPLTNTLEFKVGAVSGNITRPEDISASNVSQKTVDYGLSAMFVYTHIVSDTVASQFELGFQTLDVKTRQTPTAAGAAGNDYAQRTRDIQGAIAFEFDLSKDTSLFSKIALNQGIGLFNPSHYRLNVDDTPTVFSLNGEFTHNLPRSWQIVLRGDLQWTPDRLNELKTFSLGGWDYATGYDSGESSGDIGGGGRAELNYVGEFALPEGLNLVYKPFVFIGGGFTKTNAPDATEKGKTVSKASAGFGLSLETTHMHGSVQIAYPLSGRSDITGKKNPRILFSIGIKS